MNGFDFLKYFLDKHPFMFGLIATIIALGIAQMLGNLFKNKNQWKADVEHEKRFWK